MNLGKCGRGGYNLSYPFLPPSPPGMGLDYPYSIKSDDRVFVLVFFSFSQNIDIYCLYDYNCLAFSLYGMFILDDDNGQQTWLG